MTDAREAGRPVGAVVGDHHDLVQLSRVFEPLEAPQQHRERECLVVGRDHYREPMSRRRGGASRLPSRVTDNRRAGEKREVAGEHAGRQDEREPEQAEDGEQDLH